jgi:hypothetical protein
MVETAAVRLAVAHDDLGVDPAYSSVAASVHRLLRRGLVFALFGLLLGLGFVVAFVANDSRLSADEASGTDVEAEVLEFLVGPPRVVKVAYTVPVNGQDQYTINNIFLDSFTATYVPGDLVTVNLQPGNDRKIAIIGVEKASRFTSLPAAIMAVASLITLLYAGFEIQNAVRIRRLLSSGTWTTWAWRGVLDGPGRGRVRTAGYLSSPDLASSHLLVNQRLCWRESLDVMNGKAVVLALGDPSTAMVVRHPAAIHPAILRPAKTERERLRAEAMMTAAAITMPSPRRVWVP